MARRSLTTDRAQEMRAVVREFERSGMTAREFAAEVGIPVTTLTWWRHMWRGVDGDETRGQDRTSSSRDRFREVRVDRGDVPRSCVEVVLVGGDVVRVPVGTDRETLLAVLGALKAAC